MEAVKDSRADARFSSEKARALNKVDLSRKGNVDESIADLVGYLNSLKDFFTTSSCSGRLCVVQEVCIHLHESVQILLPKLDDINPSLSI